MKRFLVFTVVLLSSISKTFACGYTPYGENIRFSLFLPEYFDYNCFNEFCYRNELAGFYGYDIRYESNVYDWYYFTGKKVPLSSINECLTVLTLTDIDENSKNDFLHYLYENKKVDVINYLKMAKRSEAISTDSFQNTWERDEEKLNSNGDTFMKDLNSFLLKEKSGFLKRKYAFIGIRSAFYSGKREIMIYLFDTYFKSGQKDYLYYWSLYFNCFSKKNPGIDIANVMAYSPEKCYAAYYYFHEKFDLKKTLASAKSKEEKGNVYAYASVQRLDPNLDYLIKIYENSPKSKILDFLLLREINKIEDWVYTPYYTNYLPSIEFINSWYKDEVVESTNTLRNRSEKDRMYAKKVLNFVKSVDFTKVENPVLWKAAQIQLLFITRNYKECLNEIKQFEKEHPREKVTVQIEKLKALCIIANQDFGKAVIKESIKPIILKYKNDERFIFSLGRELEFRGNIGDAIALISSVDKYSDSSVSLTWRGNRLEKSGNLKYFYTYTDYLDFVYSANEMQLLVNEIDKIEKESLEFEKVIYSRLIEERNKLKDMLGTKYFREGRLEEAEKAFKSAGEKYWNDNYNAWERETYSSSYAFEENPFYDLKYTPDFIPHKEDFMVTKLSVTQYLIKYLKLADNPKTRDREYYCFLVANCYQNTSQYGHSWMMRRINSTSDFRYGIKDSYIDELEYRNNKLAQKYYMLAYKNTKSIKFRALCLRMADYAKSNYPNKFEKLKAVYPQFYDDLSSCDNLEEYFKAR
jgi:hypothetical protein